MDQNPQMKIIAHMESDFHSKFGIPRQSGLVAELEARIVFEPEYRNPDAFSGLEGFSHLWIIWQCSKAIRENPGLTVKPPRLGGKKRMGVFATRSPFRPNPIGLSSVRLERMENDPVLGPVLYVSGADLLDGTPIYDIKPYLPYADQHPDAVGGFADEYRDYHLDVDFPAELLARIPERKQAGILGVLSQDPRPSYLSDSEKQYGVEFAGFDVRFTVNGKMLTVCEVVELNPK